MCVCGKTDAFSDVFAQKVNIVTGLEARTKLIFTALALVINLVSPNIYTPISFACFSLITLLSIRVPVKVLLLRLAMPLAMAGVVLITQIFFFGETVMFTIPLRGFSLAGYEEGLARGLLIMSRVIGGVSLVLLLSMSTPADKLFVAAAWFRMPSTFIELSLLVYRYIFVLIEEFAIMKDALRVRLGFHSWRRSMKSFSVLGACLILRAYDRAERVFETMLVRGYAGARVNYIQVFTRKDGLAALCLGVILAGFYMIGRTST